MISLKFEFPVPPSVNNWLMFRPMVSKQYCQWVAKGGNMFRPPKNVPRPRVMPVKSNEFREYTETIRTILRKTLGGGFAPSTKRLGYCVHYFPKDRRRRDISNIQKILEDALQEAKLFEDDEQFDDVRVIRCGVDPAGVGKILFEVWEFPDAFEPQRKLDFERKKKTPKGSGVEGTANGSDDFGAGVGTD